MDFFEERAKQMLVLMKKHLILAIRGWKTTLVQVLAPIAFLVALLILQVVPHDGYYTDPDPPVVPIHLIPNCTTFDKPYCYSIMYAPNNIDSVNGIMQIISSQTHLPIYPFSQNVSNMPSHSIIACESYDQIINFMWGEQNVTQSVLLFYQNITGEMPSDPNLGVEYTLFYNSSCSSADLNYGAGSCPDVRYALQRTVDQAILNYVTSTSTSTINVGRKPFPVVSFSTALNDTVSTYGILFFYCGMMVGFVIIIYQIVYEKEKFLKQGMKVMGLKSSVYWITWFLYAAILVFISTILMILGGYACMFAFFLKTNVFVLFFTFMFFGISMVSLAFLVSTLVDTAKQAISIGMLLFIIGVLIQMLLTSPLFLSFLYYNNSVSEVLLDLLIWYPPYNFAKCISDITNLSFNYGEYQGPGYSWSDLYDTTASNAGTTPPATIQSWYLMMTNTVVFIILTWYFENIRNGGGPLFFLGKEYWGITRVIQNTVDGNSALVRTKEDPKLIDQDVIDEDIKAFESIGNPQFGLNVLRLSKIYRKYPFIKSKRDVHAQDSVSFCVEQGQLFCLLGHNGAGKTTTINILTGQFLPSRGDAYINGKSVLTEMNTIRQSMGVCPQHDILFEDMTAIEHLELYASIKNIPSSERPNMIAEKLADVTLTAVGNKRVSSYSGGMKRRLSVAISSIGNPDIIFLDEPTTGMDPLSRRHVWELIERMKKGRIIILTTHSMEEADILSDKIAVMAHGKIRCVGNSLHLKAKFGDGYRVNVMTRNVSFNERIKARIRSIVPNAVIIAESGTSIIFGINTAEYREIIPVFQFLETADRAEEGFIDWGISQTTLEDVFLKVTREVYSGGRRLDADPFNE